MPKGIVSTARDEKLWSKAKAIARKQYKVAEDSDRFYAIVMGIYKKMHGLSKSNIKLHPCFIALRRTRISNCKLGNTRLLIKGRKLHYKTTVQNLPVSIENRKGSIRRGKDGKGEWQTKMTAPYGYIRQTMGIDGDQVDCFIGKDKDSEWVYIIHIKDPKTGKYDEDKVFLGFNTFKDAMKVFKQNYDDWSKYYQGFDVMDMETFKKRIEKKGKKIEKSHVKGHTRKTKTGKIATVKDYENIKTKRQTSENFKPKIKKLGESIGKLQNEYVLVANAIEYYKPKEIEGFKTKYKKIVIDGDLFYEGGGLKYPQRPSEIAILVCNTNQIKNLINKYKKKNNNLTKSIRYLVKSHVKAHTRVTKTGKIVNVKNYENIKTKKVKSKSVKGHARIVQKNMEHLGTRLSDWKAVPIKNMALTEGDGGKPVMMPEFEMPKGYKSAPSMYKNNSMGSIGNCELCGHEIKNVYWIFNKRKKWVMGVGSECITMFGEGKTGKKLSKEKIWGQNRSLLREAIVVKKTIYNNYAKIVDVYDYSRGFIKKRKWANENAKSDYEFLKEITKHKYPDKESEYTSAESDTSITRWVNKYGDKIRKIIKQYRKDMNKSIRYIMKSWSSSMQAKHPGGRWITITDKSSPLSGRAIFIVPHSDGTATIAWAPHHSGLTHKTLQPKKEGKKETGERKPEKEKPEMSEEERLNAMERKKNIEREQKRVKTEMHEKIRSKLGIETEVTKVEREKIERDISKISR